MPVRIDGFHVIPWTLAAAVLGVLAFMAIGTEPESAWECTPVDPLAQTPPANPCFRATLSLENRVTLEWRVINSEPLVYIYDDFGPGYDDVGIKAAVCQSGAGDGCSTSLRVGEGGFYRWQLMVEHDRGQRIHVPASITIPAPFAPAEITGGGFVDALAPTSRTFSWFPDPRNMWFDKNIESAWIELKPPESFLWSPKHYPRLGPEASFTVPRSAFNTAGEVIYSIRDCHLPPNSTTKFCSRPVNVGFHVGSDSFLGHNLVQVNSGKDLEISFTTNSGNVRLLSSATVIPSQAGWPIAVTTGPSYIIDNALLTPGTHKLELVSCIWQTKTCANRKEADRTRERDYTDDFYPGVTHTVLGGGHALDIAYDTLGGIWLINEFSNNIEHVTATGSVESLTVPLARDPLSTPFPFAAVKPFALGVGNQNTVPVAISSLAERAASIGPKMWFTQGGGLLEGSDGEDKNQSRVISYDPLLSDSPSTYYDDRLCAYNIPTDDSKGLGNNQVIGLTATRDRIWIGESRGLIGQRTSSLSSFIASPDLCENLLNFEDPRALASQRLQYCGSGRTPEQDGCMEKLLLDALPPGIKVAHLEADPIDDSVWFTDAHGKFLGHIDTHNDNAIQIYRFPDAHPLPFDGMPGFGGYPWSLRVDEGAVYLGEYSTQHILRFDKASAVFSEIHIPCSTSQVTLHSIDIDSKTDRLWFTLSNEVQVPMDKTASTIGYIDLASWRDHIADPVRTKSISAVLYRGLDSIPASKNRPDQHQAFRGIAVDPASGKIAIATMWREQITELTPKPGFWP